MNEIRNIDELEELRQKWEDVNRRLERLEKGTVDEGRRVCSRNVRTAKDDLARRYKRFMFVELVMSVVVLCQFGAMTHRGIGNEFWLICSTIAFPIFFLVAFVMDLHLYNALSRMDLSVMTVKEVVSEARTLKRRHHIFQAVLIPFVLICLGCMAMAFVNDDYVLAGMATGGAVGLAIGLKQYLDMMKDYREMMRQYED